MATKSPATPPAEPPPANEPATTPEGGESPKPAAKEPAPTEDELKKSRRDMIAATWGESHVPPELRDEPKPEDDAEKPKEEPAKAEGDEGDEPPAEPPKPSKKKPVAKSKTAPSSDELITKAASETGKAVAREMARHQEVEEEPAVTAPVTELNADDQRDYTVLREMEAIFPDARGVSNKFTDYCRKRYDYQAKWEAGHEGDTFNFDDAEHQAWIDKNQPKIDPEQFDEAKAAIRYQRMKDRDPEVQEIRAGKALFEAAPKITANIDNRIAQLVETFDEELGKLVRNEKGKPDLTDAAVKRLEDADPIAKDILENLINTEFHPMVEELEKTILPGYRLQPERNPVHANLISHLQKAEQDVQQLPPDEQLWEGRKFLTNAQMASMRDKAIQSNLADAEKSKRIKSIENNYWTIGIDELEDLLVDHFVGKARKEVTRINLLSGKSGKTKNGASAETGQEPKTEPQEKPIVKTQKPRPPSTASGSDTQTNRDSNAIDSKTFQENAEKSFFG